MNRRARAAAVVAVMVVAACSESSSSPRGPEVHEPPPTLALLPSAPTALAPSHARLQGGGPSAGEAIADVSGCASCHADVAAQWRTSTHAFASFNNPIYRSAVERFRKDRGKTKSRFCAGCHDIALLADGAMDTDIDPADPRAHAGVSCRTCHGIQSARPDGNGSYTLNALDFPVPAPGDGESLSRHKAHAAPSPLRTAAMCIACHRAFLDETTGNAHHLSGQDDATPWMRSAYGGSVAERVDVPIPEQDCRSCHMPREDATRGDAAAKNGRVASHRRERSRPQSTTVRRFL